MRPDGTLDESCTPLYTRHSQVPGSLLIPDSGNGYLADIAGTRQKLAGTRQPIIRVPIMDPGRLLR